MEITKKGKFITDFYGSAPAIGAAGILQKWIDDKQSAWLLSWAEKVKKRGQTAINALEEILSVFHRNGDTEPILGNWMLRKCLINTGQAIFNAQKDKTHPKKAIIPMAITLVEPLHIQIFNGKLIKDPQGIKTYTVTTKGRSFFKAYEYIKAGATFETIMHFDDDLLKEEHIDKILDKCGLVGVGAYRERFGKFVWV